MADARLSFLLTAYLNGVASVVEEQELFVIVRQNGEDPELSQFLEQAWQDYHTEQQLSAATSNGIIQSILKEGAAFEKTATPLITMRWLRVAAAALIALLLGAGLYFDIFYQRRPASTITKANVEQDIAPPQNTRATITIADGKTLFLDSITSGILVEQGGVALEKLEDGQIAYTGSDKNESTQIVYNTLSNPRGSPVIDITLSDGSRVWLNAGSSIRYPIAFLQKTREVELHGEGYFEVAKDLRKHFVVFANGTRTEVLGTHFNVNAYDDEADIKITLLEGSVKVIKQDQSDLLKPGQQAAISSNIKVLNAVDVEAIVAWKNGLFAYKSADIETIMRQVARWYDVDVKIEKGINEKFYAEVPRNTNVSMLFKMLETTGAVHFKIEGKIVTVSP